MSHDLRDRLHDLAGDVSLDVAPRQLASSSWAAGRRRRVRRRGLAAGAVLGLLAIVAGTVLGLGFGERAVQPIGSDRSIGIRGYPARITHSWFTPVLPARPGPVAGLLHRPDGLWDVVSEHGRLWKSPAPLEFGDQYPTLSPNGRYLGYLAGPNGPFVIRDLVTGASHRVAEIGCGCSGPHLVPTARLWMEGQSPTFWSPDNRWVLFRGNVNGASDRIDGILVAATGDARTAALPGTWLPAGWAGPRRLVWTDLGRRSRQGRVVVDVRTTDLSGRLLRTVQVRLPRHATRDSLSQWSWTVSPAGNRLLFMPDMVEAPSAVATYSLADGSMLTRAPAPDTQEACPGGWAGATPIVPEVANGDIAETVTANRESTVLSVADPALGSHCVVWAQSALAGTAHAGIFGTATASWTWWWREALATVGALALAVVVGRLVGLRRSRIRQETGRR
jgi:hypothetical protein